MRKVHVEWHGDKVGGGQEGSFHAHFAGQPETWQSGKTEEKAIEMLRQATRYTGEIEIVRERSCGKCAYNEVSRFERGQLGTPIKE